MARSNWLIAPVLVGAAVIGAGNLAIVWLWQQRQKRLSSEPPVGVSGIENLHIVDATVWRGGAPTPDGYRSLAAAGVRTVIDLRAEGGAGPPDDAGLEVLRFPIRDGQPPDAAQTDRILAAIDAARPPVFVHCAAGVGRTGSVVAAYLIRRRGASIDGALTWLLGVGPPSLEQIAYVRSRGTDPGIPATAVSRLLDAPRRTWSRIRDLAVPGHQVGDTRLIGGRPLRELCRRRWL